MQTGIRRMRGAAAVPGHSIRSKTGAGDAFCQRMNQGKVAPRAPPAQASRWHFAGALLKSTRPTRMISGRLPRGTIIRAIRVLPETNQENLP